MFPWPCFSVGAVLRFIESLLSVCVLRATHFVFSLVNNHRLKEALVYLSLSLSFFLSRFSSSALLMPPHNQDSCEGPELRGDERLLLCLECIFLGGADPSTFLALVVMSVSS